MNASIPAAARPPLPKLVQNGAYDRNDLTRYLVQARRNGMMDGEIARHLDVPLHRVIYFCEVLFPRRLAAPAYLSRSRRMAAVVAAPRKNGWSDLDLKLAVEMHSAGKTAVEIAAVLGRTKNAVLGQLFRLRKVKARQ